ncbi:hypothetical protein EMIT0232MI5_30377 [Pseudomonas sp. IT-232MI5]
MRALRDSEGGIRGHDFYVGAAEGCDLLILILKIKVKRSQPSAAPTGFPMWMSALLCAFA